MSRSKSSPPSQRMLRVGELVRHTLADFFAREEIADEELRGVALTFPEVRMTPDLKRADIFVMPLGGARAKEIAAALNRHSKYIRGQIVPKLGLRFAPQFQFLVDESFGEADRIEELLRSERVARDLKRGQ